MVSRELLEIFRNNQNKEYTVLQLSKILKISKQNISRTIFKLYLQNFVERKGEGYSYEPYRYKLKNERDIL